MKNRELQSSVFPSNNILSYNFGRILFQPGAKLLNKSTFSQKKSQVGNWGKFCQIFGVLAGL